MRQFSILIAVAALAGCSTSAPIKTGPDTYIITASHTLVVGKQADGQALQKASAHCASLGAQMQLVDLQSTQPVFSRPGTATLQYRCVHL